MEAKEMKIVIQKFGGTSVANSEVRLKAVQKIINAKRSGFQPVVVVSAIGRRGDPYATDTLIDYATAAHQDIHPREKDLIMSCGEIISAVVMVNTLKSKGYEARALTGAQAGIITNSQYTDADIIEIKPDKIYKTIESGRIPIVAGFQGVTADGEITTLGRGGSDVTAVALGEALSAAYIEIYTDVDGIMTADPRIVSNASVIQHINYSDVLEMASEGAKVIHPRAIEFAMRSNIPVFIKNTLNNAPGTIISQDFSSTMPKLEDKESKRVVTSIAYITDRAQVVIQDICSEDQNLLLTKMAKNNISIDLINIFPEKIIFTIDQKEKSKIEEILQQCGYKYKITENCSKVSAIGSRMRGVPGVMARIIKALSRENIQILQTADSHTTIACLVKGEDTTKAVIALHQEFELYKK